tara:strand:- start:200 stop:988 length:789 start_codon:yes stop_codon:yes gene_type:complete
MKRYLKTLKLFWINALAVQVEYQINFLIEILSMIGTLIGSIFILSLFFRNGSTLGEWSWEAALLIQGFYTLLDGFTNTLLRPNLTEIVNYVREGTLDFVLIKPIDSQFWLSTRKLSPSGLPEMILGIGLISWSVLKLKLEINFNIIILGVIMLLASLIILYSIWFLIAATSIWFVKTWNATEVLRAFLAAGRFPTNSYPLTLRIIFTSILPITFLTTVPAKVLLGEIEVELILLGLSISLTFYLISRKFWKYAVKHYSSASS